MRILNRTAFVSTVLIHLALTPSIHGEISLPAILADHMVLQCDTPIQIWGDADAGQMITARFGHQQQSTRADNHGHWFITLEPMPACATPADLTVISDDQTVTLQDVLVGEVWLCSGQSNMEWPVNASQNAQEYKDAATNSAIRMFIVPALANDRPQESGQGQWWVASPQSVGRFSAVAYHFGLNLAANLDVPVGLINSSWGGSAVEAWVSRDALEDVNAAKQILTDYDLARSAQSREVASFVLAEFDDSTWETMTLPSLIEDHGLNLDGVFWFRRKIPLPHEWLGLDLTLNLGPIDDNDQTFVNAVPIGQTNNWMQPRTYRIPAPAVDQPTITIAIRVEDTGGAGGFSGSAEEMSIHPALEPHRSIALSGPWRYRVTSQKRLPYPNQRPANLYNAMIHPIRRYTIRGVIWYQGETNAIAPRGDEYYPIFSTLIYDWRKRFNNPDFPFLFVQLPNFASDEPETRWRYPVVRQAQLDTLKTVTNTGMAITLDIGDPADIHPRNKHDVGQRLAHWALNETYGLSELVKSGPIPLTARFLSDGSIIVRFDLFGSTLMTGDGTETVTSIEISGPDGTFKPATGIVKGDTITVSDHGIGEPTAIRYAWKNNPDDANLINALGWPASPFVFQRP